MEQTPLLDERECRAVVESVDALRPSWEQRRTSPFFTLGAAAYLDGGDDETSKDGYHHKAATLNRALETSFAWVYERLRRALERHLGAPCRYDLDGALPGFHIFLPHLAFAVPAAQVHYDLQFLHRRWARNGFDIDRPVSFTVPIALPRAGGGLNFWDLRFPGGLEAALRPDLKAHYFGYEVGSLALHDGLGLHQIAPWRKAQGVDASEDRRITLQGHALFAEGTWWIYW
jgi:hypothetical protein